jgi:hypothetical protein
VPFIYTPCEIKVHQTGNCIDPTNVDKAIPPIVQHRECAMHCISSSSGSSSSSNDKRILEWKWEFSPSCIDVRSYDIYVLHYVLYFTKHYHHHPRRNHHHTPIQCHHRRRPD